MAQSSSQPSNWRIMQTLIAKDWRLYRVPFVALLVTSAGCYALGFSGALYRLPDTNGPRDSFYAASIIAANLTAMMAATFGGMAIAGERSDRTADFLSLLPVTRRQIVISKWLVSFFILAAFGILNGLVGLLLMDPRWVNPSSLFVPAVVLWIGCATCLYGVAWLFSTCLNSGPISACISIATTLAWAAFTEMCVDYIPTLIAMFTTHRVKSWAEWKIQPPTAILIAAMGLSCAVAGSKYYQRRIAP